MKVYKVELMLIDFDGLGEESISDTIENTKYPNYCISPQVVKIDSRDIGEWADDHPLNQKGHIEVFKSMFDIPAQPAKDSEK